MEINWLDSCDYERAVETLFQSSSDKYQDRQSKAAVYRPGAMQVVDIVRDAAGAQRAVLSRLQSLPGLTKRARKHQMPLLLWVRLFIESGLRLKTESINGLEQWMVKTAGGRPVLSSDLGEPSGFTPLQLLLRQHWKRPVYTKAWEALASGVGKARRPLSAAEMARRTVQRCGSHAVDALTEAVRREVNRPQSKRVIEPPAKDGDRGTTELSRDKLVDHLQAQYDILRAYKPSTLKSAITQLVACPRGRPPPKQRPKRKAP